METSKESSVEKGWPLCKEIILQQLLQYPGSNKLFAARCVICWPRPPAEIFSSRKEFNKHRLTRILTKPRSNNDDVLTEWTKWWATLKWLMCISLKHFIKQNKWWLTKQDDLKSMRTEMLWVCCVSLHSLLLLDNVSLSSDIKYSTHKFTCCAVIWDEVTRVKRHYKWLWH